MKCVILDQESLDIGDIDFTAINHQCDEVTSYPYTNAEDRLTRINDADIVITNKVILDEEVIEKLDKLKFICVAATGFNNVDIKTANKHGIAVCNVTGYATSSVVQHVFSLILALSRNLLNYTNAVKDNKWQRSRQFCLLDYPITGLAGKNLGIIGYGELGKAVAEAGKAFGMNILIAESLTGNKSPERIPLEKLLNLSDILSLHCPLTSESQNLINKKTLGLMKKSALLINTARGGIVNEAYLWDALNNKQIAGAAVDVLSQEPPIDNILIDKPLPNLIVTPHIAWASQSSRQKLVDEIAKNIEAFKAGEVRNRIE